MWLLLLALAGAAYYMVTWEREEEIEPPPLTEIPSAEIPTEDELLAIDTAEELRAYQELIEQLWIIGKLPKDEYLRAMSILSSYTIMM